MVTANDVSKAERKAERARATFIDEHYAEVCRYFAANLIRIRTAKGITQSDLARRIYVRPTACMVTHYEQARRLPSVDRLVLIARALGVPVGDLLAAPRAPSPFD